MPRTISALSQAIRHERPHILYVYSHGQLVAGQTGDILRLFMQASDDPEDGAETLAAARLADFLSGDASVLAALSLVYLNCCWGGTAARGGSPFEIAPLVPALISNRTSALVSGGRQQAVDILTSITGRGAAPHEAVALIANDARSLSGWWAGMLDGADEPWWMTPTVFANYERWREPVKQTGRAGFTLRETLELDRTLHADALRTHMTADVGARKVSLFLWWGGIDDGVETLADRLKLQLRQSEEKVWRLCLREVDWPAECEALRDREQELGRLIATELRAAAGVDPAEPDAMASAAVRQLGVGGGTMLITFATIPRGLDPADVARRLRAAIRALADELGRPLRQNAAAGAVRVVAFLRLNCEAGEDLPEKISGVMEAGSEYIAMLPLPPLHPVVRTDVATFLGRHAADYPLSERGRIAREIIDETQGRFEPARAAIVLLNP